MHWPQIRAVVYESYDESFEQKFSPKKEFDIHIYQNSEYRWPTLDEREEDYRNSDNGIVIETYKIKKVNERCTRCGSSSNNLL